MPVFEIKFDVITDRSILSIEELELIRKAEEILQKAYSPYSKFKVGASLLLENGLYLEGNNQENASFPCGICAERVVLSYAQANYPDLKIKKIAITTTAQNFEIKSPVAPCGMCRQVILEYELKQNFPIEIFLFDTEKLLKFKQAKDLLPLYFSEDRLKRK